MCPRFVAFRLLEDWHFNKVYVCIYVCNLIFWQAYTEQTDHNFAKVFFIVFKKLNWRCYNVTYRFLRFFDTPILNPASTGLKYIDLRLFNTELQVFVPVIESMLQASYPDISGVWVKRLENNTVCEIFIVLWVQTTSGLLTYCFRSLDIEGRPRISWSREHGLSWPPWNNACFGALFVIVKFIVFDDSSVWTNTNRKPNNINPLNCIYRRKGGDKYFVWR